MARRRPYYKEPVFRPPSEAGSLLIQATEGCTHRCTFCISNYGKGYLVRPVDEIVQDINAARDIHGQGVRRLFFLDGNALSMPASDLLAITRHAMETFPRLERVGVYACGEDVLAKTDGELRALADAGLRIIYVGLETGDDTLLHDINKRITATDLSKAAWKAMAAGITFSGTIILGLAGNDKDASRAHATRTAALINEIGKGAAPGQDWYIGALTLMIPPHTAVEKRTRDGTFHPMNEHEILEELRILIENVDASVHDCIFRSNHASNYLVLKGVLARDKAAMLARIDDALANPARYLRPELYRAL